MSERQTGHRKSSLVLSARFTARKRLSNDDGAGDENGNKPIGLDWQDNIFACTSRFFVHFFAVVARLQRENA